MCCCSYMCCCSLDIWSENINFDKGGTRMRKFSGILVVVMTLALGLSVAHAETLTYTIQEQRLQDTPTKYGPKGTS